jgi:hypothetical protein
MSSFCVANLRNSPLLRAIRALHPKGTKKYEHFGSQSTSLRINQRFP